MDKHWKRGEKWYHSLYDDPTGMKFVGEASNSYSATQTYPDTPGRIYNYNKHSRIIYIVRHPMHRTESDWMEATKSKSISFEEFLRSDTLCQDKNHYLLQYNNYLKFFNSESILVLLFDDLVDSFLTTQQRISNFLDIRFDSTTLPSKRNTADQKKRLQMLLSIQKSDFYASIRKYIPTKARSFAMNATARGHIISRPEWSDQDRHSFKNEFELVSKQFLETTGYDPCTWKW